MKQLSIRLFAPFTIVAAITARCFNFFSRKINFALSIPQQIVGKWRLYLNYCPECNSCAPKIHHCEVCNADTKSYFNWNDDVKRTWWKKYTEKHHIAA